MVRGKQGQVMYFSFLRPPLPSRDSVPVPIFPPEGLRRGRRGMESFDRLRVNPGPTAERRGTASPPYSESARGPIRQAECELGPHLSSPGDSPQGPKRRGYSANRLSTYWAASKSARSSSPSPV